MRFVLLVLSILLTGCDYQCRESVKLLEANGIRGETCESFQKMVITKLSETTLQVTCTCPGRTESRK